MAHVISLLLIPTGAEEDAPPEIYVDAGGVWRSPGDMSVPAQKLPELRASLAKVLTDLSELLDVNPGAADATAIRADGTEFFHRLVPVDIQHLLRSALDAGGDAPVLRIHAAERYDWIPWELFYDDERQHFLGLRFVVSRLPIVPNPPEISGGSVRQVQHIHHYLGPGVAEEIPALFTAWEGTFHGLTNGAQIEVRPSPGPANWPRILTVGESLKTDILHLTCHGMRKDNQFLLNLAPNDPIPSLKALGPRQINTFLRTLTRPLVFGNACNPPGGLKDLPKLEPSGLGKAFFMKGALNIVSTLAPVSRALALDFARKFYELLLTAPERSTGQALLETKQHFEGLGGNDPSYLFYSLYGPPETKYQTHA